MKVWATSFVVLFGLVELFQWVQHFNFAISLPLPVFILAGAFLAIASNYDKRAGVPFHLRPEDSGAIANPPTNALQASATSPVQFSSPQPTQQPELPTFNSPTANTQSQRSISFTIQRSNQSESK